MSVIPHEVVALFAAAALSRAINRTPPLWERLLSGLRFYAVPFRADVERVLDAGTRATVRPFADGAPATLLQQANDAVAVRGRTVTYSYFPLQTVPWSSMVARDVLAATVVTTTYAALALALISTLECAKASPPALHSDAITLVAVAVAALALASHLLQRLAVGGVRNLEVALSLAAGAVGWALALALAVGALPATRWLAEPPVAWAPGGARAAPLALAAALSLAPGALSALLLLPAMRLARCLHDARRDAADSDGAAAGRRVVALAAATVAPLVLVAAFAPSGVRRAFVAPDAAGAEAEAAAARAGVAQAWVAAAAVALHAYGAVRPGLAAFLAAPRRRMAEQLVETGAMARRLVGAGGREGASLSPASVDLVMRELERAAARPQYAAALAALHLLAPPVLLGGLAALAVRQGGGGGDGGIATQGLGVCGALEGALAAAGIAPSAWHWRRSGGGDGDDGAAAALRAAVAAAFPGSGALFAPAAARRVIAWLLVAPAICFVAATLAAAVWWEAGAPAVAAAEARRAAAPAGAGAGEPPARYAEPSSG